MIDTKTINYPNSNPLTNDSMKLILKKEIFDNVTVELTDWWNVGLMAVHITKTATDYEYQIFCRVFRGIGNTHEITTTTL